MVGEPTSILRADVVLCWNYDSDPACALVGRAENAAAVPLNFTAVAPVRLLPVMVTLAATGPLVGVNDVSVGAGLATVKDAFSTRALGGAGLPRSRSSCGQGQS